MEEPLDERAVVAAYARLFDGLEQLGPTTDATRRAVLETFRDRLPGAPAVADMGCGAGAASRWLAGELDAARIVALDLHLAFVARLRRSSRLAAVVADMTRPPVAPASLDLVWCDAAVYAVGRTRALEAWRPLLKPGAFVAFSDVVWTAADPPERSRAFWAGEYPAMTTAEGVERELAAAGFALEARLEAPRSDWEAYYAPLRPRVEALSPAATGALAAVLAGLREELAVFELHGDTFASAWFVARDRSQALSSTAARHPTAVDESA